MMTARVLDYAEWDRLPEELDPLLMDLKPGQSRVCVIEDNGEIVARVILMSVLMAECLWVAPERRRTRVGLKLLNLMKRTARSLGYQRVRTASISEDVTKLMCNPRIRAEAIPALTFVMQVGE